ncbi:hypothetical protein K435DRAFT_937993 [Dendrothele bispora CBS 962.96]|uniref:Uncharacterized protein n=1 Tax=Dendrothele bispora (strain CBS 962.96) TaxID=1314807 RepID=A0A4S8MCI2_DENBC|nr:hypothetical protein K435DRAFT_937993 [Dendrothele bispora CBS 962.96]
MNESGSSCQSQASSRLSTFPRMRAFSSSPPSSALESPDRFDPSLELTDLARLVPAFVLVLLAVCDSEGLVTEEVWIALRRVSVRILSLVPSSKLLMNSKHLDAVAWLILVCPSDGSGGWGCSGPFDVVEEIVFEFEPKVEGLPVGNVSDMDGLIMGVHPGISGVDLSHDPSKFDHPIGDDDILPKNKSTLLDSEYDHWMTLIRVIQGTQVFIERCYSFGAETEQALRLIETRAVKRNLRKLEDAYYGLLNFIITFHLYEYQRLARNEPTYVPWPHWGTSLPGPWNVEPGAPLYMPYPLTYRGSDQSMNSHPVEFFSNATHAGLNGSSVSNIRGNQTQSLNNSGTQSWGNSYNFFLFDGPGDPRR